MFLTVLRLTVSQAHPGKVHIAVDGWTSPNVYLFLGIMVHFIKYVKMHHLILDFIQSFFLLFGP